MMNQAPFQTEVWWESQEMCLEGVTRPGSNLKLSAWVISALALDLLRSQSLWEGIGSAIVTLELGVDAPISTNMRHRVVAHTLGSSFKLGPGHEKPAVELTGTQSGNVHTPGVMSCTHNPCCIGVSKDRSPWSLEWLLSVRGIQVLLRVTWHAGTAWPGSLGVHL